MDIFILTVVTIFSVYVNKFKDDFKKEDTEILFPFLFVVVAITVLITAILH